MSDISGNDCNCAEIETLVAERDDLRAELALMRDESAMALMHNVFAATLWDMFLAVDINNRGDARCSYCGAVMPREATHEHMTTCDRHPYAALKDANTTLVAAILGAAEDERELCAQVADAAAASWAKFPGTDNGAHQQACLDVAAAIRARPL